jgi:hypothetical protein
MGYGIPDLRMAFSWLLAEYATVTAQLSNCTVTVNWKSKDVEGMRYELQRMLPGENSYSTLQQVVPASGTVLRNSNYQYTDRIQTTLTGPIKYRVVQWIDTALATRQSVLVDSASVVLTNTCVTPTTPQATIQLYPNPASNSTRLIVNYAGSNSQLLVSISDMAGRIVSRYQVPLRSPSSSSDLSLEAYPKGTYLITVWDQDKKIGATKLVKD